MLFYNNFSFNHGIENIKKKDYRSFREWGKGISKQNSVVLYSKFHKSQYQNCNKEGKKYIRICITRKYLYAKKTLEEKKVPRPWRHCYYADDCCTQSPKKSLENQQSNLHKQKTSSYTFLTLSKCIFSQYCSYKHFSKYKYKLTPPNFWACA